MSVCNQFGYYGISVAKLSSLHFVRRQEGLGSRDCMSSGQPRIQHGCSNQERAWIQWKTSAAPTLRQGKMLLRQGKIWRSKPFFFWRNLKGWFPKGWFWRMFPRNENRNEGTFGCSPGTKTGTRVRLPKPPFYETALLSPGDFSAHFDPFFLKMMQAKEGNKGRGPKWGLLCTSVSPPLTAINGY